MRFDTNTKVINCKRKVLHGPVKTEEPQPLAGPARGSPGAQAPTVLQLGQTGLLLTFEWFSPVGRVYNGQHFSLCLFLAVVLIWFIYFSSLCF